MKPSHIIVRAQIIIADAYTRLLTHAKTQLGINQPEHPIEPQKPAYQVLLGDRVVYQASREDEAVWYRHVAQLNNPSLELEVVEVEPC